jgi:hypothetical protein
MQGSALHPPKVSTFGIHDLVPNLDPARGT